MVNLFGHVFCIEENAMSNLKSSRINLRLSKQELTLLRSAASDVHLSLSQFIRRNAVRAAESNLLQHRQFQISEEQWAEAEACSKRPASNN